MRKLIEQTETSDGLRLKAVDSEAQEELRELRGAEDENSALCSAMEYQLCNGWRRVLPEECGALTDGFLLTRDWDEDDHGDLTRLGRVYWDSNYAVQSTMEKLAEGREVFWIGQD